jgi:hypothetical protein
MMQAMQILLFVGVLFGLIVWVCQQAGLTLKTAIDVFSTFIMITVICALFLSLVACGPKSSTHTVQGEATVKIVVGVDLTVCDQFPESSERLECIKALLDLAKIMNETDDEESGFEGVAGI